MPSKVPRLKSRSVGKLHLVSTLSDLYFSFSMEYAITSIFAHENLPRSSAFTPIKYTLHCLSLHRLFFMIASQPNGYLTYSSVRIQKLFEHLSSRKIQNHCSTARIQTSTAFQIRMLGEWDIQTKLIDTVINRCKYTSTL